MSTPFFHSLPSSLRRFCWPLPIALLALTAACSPEIDRKVHIEGGLANLNATTSIASSEASSVAAFASLPAITHLQLSPSGEYLAFLQNTEGQTILVTRATYSNGNGEDVHIVLKSDNDKFRIANYYWLSDKELLVSVRYPDRRYGIDSIEGRMLSVSRDGSETHGELFRRNSDVFQASQDRNRNPIPQLQDQIVARLPDDPNHVLLALDLINPGQPDVYKVDVHSGERSLVQRNKPGINKWLADARGEVRLGIAMLNTPYRVLIRQRDSSVWETPTALEKRRHKGENVHPLGFDGDSAILYFAASHQGKSAIFRLDTGKPDAKEELVAADPDYDIEGPLIFSAHPKQPIGVYYAADEVRSIYWDKQTRQKHERINRTLPGRSNMLASSDRNGKRHIIMSSSPTQPPQYYLLDDETNRMTLLADVYPNIHADRLSTPRAIHFKARDGLDIPGYLTLPKEGGERNLPTVVFPHGGPWTRDINDFDYWTQFFASRGWAVLQINFRGSAGFGEKFERAGFQRWGLEMQNDISDGVAWVRAQGIADANKICIVGGSYGGYAALMGLAQTPDLFRCGVSFAGVADLLGLLSHLDNYLVNETEIDQQLGGWWSDHQRLKATSPITLAKNIRAPLLIVHGVQDRSVPVSQSQGMVAALKDASFNHFKYLELPLADHHLSREEDRLRFFSEMEQFLKTYLDSNTNYNGSDSFTQQSSFNR